MLIHLASCRLLSIRTGLPILVLGALLVPGEANTQEVELLAGGDLEWSRLPYAPSVAYWQDPGDWIPIPYLNLEENRDSIRARMGTDDLDVTYADRHYLTLQHDLTFETDEEGWRHPFQRTAELLRGADIAFANLEMPISDEAQVRQIASVGAVGFADAMGWAGFDVISLANNRMLDAETIGLLDTMKALSDAGVGWVGAGRDLEEARRPLIVERNGLRIAFLAYTYGVSWFGADGFARPGGAGVMALDPLIIREDIRTARDNAEFVVLSFHWGVGTDEIPEEAREFAREMIDAGADAILGHHSHVPKGVEVYKGRVILYSLANFAFGHSHDYFIDNYMARLTFTSEGIRRAELIPIAGKGLDVVQPYPLQGDRAESLLRRVAEMSAKLGTHLTLDGNTAFVDLDP